MALPNIVPKEGEMWRHGFFGEKTFWYFYKGRGNQLKRGQFEPVHTPKFPLTKIEDKGYGRVHFQGTFGISGEFSAEGIVHGRNTWERLWNATVPPPRGRL
ncbi:MAG: hypothetical protein V1814_01040 [Candidatus Moraniibacteriota bacterium]